MNQEIQINLKYYQLITNQIITISFSARKAGRQRKSFSSNGKYECYE